MNKKQWTLAYRMYRICCQQAQRFNWDEPDFFLNYRPGSFHQIRQQNIVLNVKTGFSFGVKEWHGKKEELHEKVDAVRFALASPLIIEKVDSWDKKPPSLRWTEDTLYSRWIGWYVLIATRFFPDDQSITPRQWEYLEKLEKEKK